MERRAVSGIVLTLLLASILGLAFNIPSVKASGTVYIKADGSIDPPTANITTVDNVIYTLKGNVSDSIVVERSNIIIDGKGYTVQGTGAYDSKGIFLSEISNVTIKKINIKGFNQGIVLNSTSQTVISRNNITENNYEGIKLVSSLNNSIRENKIANNGLGISFANSSDNDIYGNNITASDKGYAIWFYDSSSNNSIGGNNITDNWSGISLGYSSNNSIGGNNITENDRNGIGLVSSSNNNIIGNNMTANNYGVGFSSSSNNNITGNNIRANNNYGIDFYQSSHNIISGNNLTETINYDGINLHDYSSHNIISGNNITSNNNVGIDFVSYSSSNSVLENNITHNNAGITLGSSSYNNISGNNVTNNRWGLVIVFSSSNNKISENNITESNVCGILLSDSSTNSIYHNNFVGNTNQVDLDNSVNVWDNGYPLGGNYWSNYIGSDKKSGPNQDQLGSDGIGDTPHTLDDYNVDHYPLMSPWALIRTIQTSLRAGGREYIISIETNATLANVRATSVTLRFRSSGIPGQTYFINVTFPKINKTEISIFIDGEKLIPPPFPIITANSTHYFIYFEFTASTHEITVQYATTNIATTDLVPFKTAVGAGYSTPINVTVENQGISTETFDVTIYANTTAIQTKTITLSSENNATLTFTWSTTEFAKGNYTISAHALPLPNEADTEDNNLTDGWVLVTKAGDFGTITGGYYAFDDQCDYQDLFLFRKTYTLEYHPLCDFDNDNDVDYMDLFEFRKCYLNP